MASSKNSNEHQKSNWDDMAIEDSASDLEDSWAGEEVMFDGSPSSGINFLGFLATYYCLNSFDSIHDSTISKTHSLIQLLF